VVRYVASVYRLAHVGDRPLLLLVDVKHFHFHYYSFSSHFQIYHVIFSELPHPANVYKLLER
jgi:hypothetical protein